MRASPWTTGWLLLVMVGTADVAAQEPSPPSRICYRGRPLPHCSAFWITEANYYRQLVGTDYERSFPIPGGEPFVERGDALGTHLSWELGGMVNRGANTAVGATVQLGASDVGIRGGLIGRYRRWLGPATTGDLGLGLLYTEVRTSGDVNDRAAIGVTADGALGVADIVALTGRVDLLAAGDDFVGAAYGGVRLGSYAAIGGTVVLFAIVALAIAALSGLQ